MDACHRGTAHWNLVTAGMALLLFEQRNNDSGLYRLVFGLNKICNGAIYTDAQYLNCLPLCFLRGVANYNPIIHSTIYIAVYP